MQSYIEITSLPCSMNASLQPRMKCRSLQEDKPLKKGTIRNTNGPHLNTPVDVKMDAILMTFQLQWMWIHLYLLESNMPTLKMTKTAIRKKADASIAISKATWHANVQRRNSNMDNLTNPVPINLDMINCTPNLTPSSKRGLMDQNLWDKDSERRIGSATSHRSKMHTLKMPKNRR